LILRERFDYTEWQRDLFKDMPLNEFLEKAMGNRERKRGKASSIVGSGLKQMNFSAERGVT
jgi:hypothetical protein